MNKIKLFWMCVLLVIFLGYKYFYTYGGQEGLKMFGDGFEMPDAISVTKDVRITSETLNDNYGPKSIKHALTKKQYSK